MVVNTPKVVLTADKAATKEAIRHSRHPGGLRRQAYGDLLDHGQQPPRTVGPHEQLDATEASAHEHTSA